MLHASVLLLLAGLALSESKAHPATPRWYMRNNDHGSDRIIGGKETEPHAYPFMVSIQYNKDKLPICGGSLLNERYVLTAAHCVFYPKSNINHKPEDIYVVLGEHHLFRKDGEIKRNIDKIIRHEVYPHGESKFDSDIAVIRMDEPTPFNDFISLICLSTKINLVNEHPTVTGWGETLDRYVLQKILLEVEVPVLDDFWCEDAYHKNYYEPHMICAGYPWTKNYKDICTGDSGGPLFLNPAGSRPAQIGIVSFSSFVGCASLNYPSVYTKVSAFRSWIETNVEGPVCFTS